MSKLGLNNILLIGLVIALMLSKSGISIAIAIIAFLGYKAYENYLVSKTVVDTDQALKDRVTNLESKLAYLGMNKRNV
jgi:Tfp pilus assembly major pilin PilA